MNHHPFLEVSHDITKQNILIIGGSSGIGLATAQLALAEGAHIVIASRSPEKARASLGNQIETAALDMSEEAQVKAFFENHQGTFQHILVSSAMPGTSVLLEANIAQARKIFDTKYWGSYYVARYGIPKLAVRGSLTFVTGVVPFKVMAGTTTMAAINSALIGLTRTLAVEVTPRRVNVVSPGITATSAWEKLPIEEREAFLTGLAQQLPAGKVGEPADLAESVLFLMKNSYITGTVLHVEGGHQLI
jgi:NAD(P)-dependent dehydrogenase (short-subunit alcohol dehydrogenase family)